MAAQALLPAALSLFQLAAACLLAFAVLSLLRTWAWCQLALWPGHRAVLTVSTAAHRSEASRSAHCEAPLPARACASGTAAPARSSKSNNHASIVSKGALLIDSVVDAAISAHVPTCEATGDGTEFTSPAPAQHVLQPHGPITRIAVMVLASMLTPCFIAAAASCAAWRACKPVVAPLLFPLAVGLQMALLPVRAAAFASQVLRFMAYRSASVLMKGIIHSATLLTGTAAVQHTAQAIGSRYQAGRSQVHRVCTTPPQTYLQHTANGIVRMALGAQASTRMTSHATRAQVALRVTHAGVLLWLRCVWFAWCIPDHAAVFAQSLRSRANAARMRAKQRLLSSRHRTAARFSVWRSKALCRCIMAQQRLGAAARVASRHTQAVGKAALQHGVCGAAAAAAAHYAGIFAYSVAAAACSTAQVTAQPCSRVAERAEDVLLLALVGTPCFFMAVYAARQVHSRSSRWQ